MNAKVEVAKVVVELCEKHESIRRTTTLGTADVNKLFEEEFAKVRRAFQMVIDAASVSQPTPPDFQNGQPGLAPCQCPLCKARREADAGVAPMPAHPQSRLINPASGEEWTMLERIRCATIANNGAATLRARGKDEAADALLSVRRDIENGIPAGFAMPDVSPSNPSTPEKPYLAAQEELKVSGDVRNAWPVDANGSPVTEK